MRPCRQPQLKQGLVSIAEKFYQTLLKIQPDMLKELNNLQRSVTIINNSLAEQSQEPKETLISKSQEQFPQKKKKKYRVYSVSQKQMIVDEVKKQLSETDFSLTSIIKTKSDQYDIHTKNITRWYKLDKIKERQGGRKPAFPEIQQKLIIHMSQNPKMKRKDAIDYAKKLYDEMKDESKRQIFFSKGWYQRFKVRNKQKLKNSRHKPQTLPVIEKAKKKSYVDCQIKLQEDGSLL